MQTNASINSGQMNQTPGAPLKLQPSVITGVTKGEGFELELWVDCASGQPVAAVDAFMDFNPTYLSVVSLTPITTSLPTLLASSIDNENGQLGYSAGTLFNFPTGSFQIATVRFLAKEAVESTLITFSSTPPRESIVAWQGGAVTLAGGTVDVDTQTVQVSVNHFSIFFLAEGSEMYPPPVTQGVIGQPVTIQASMVNFVPVQSATLHYRVGAAEWKSLEMPRVNGINQTTIPADNVTAAGLAYYIEATDGNTVATYPIANPVDSPQAISLSLASLSGDANGDSQVNAINITKVERIIAGLDLSTPGADANQDGNINALDITKVERIIAGLD